MSDPDDPSSSGFKEHHPLPSEWDKEIAHIGSAPASASRSSSNASSDPKPGGSDHDAANKERSGKRDRVFRRLRSSRRKHRHHGPHNEMQFSEKESSGAARPDSATGAADTKTASDGPSALDRGAGGDEQKHNSFVRLLIIIKEILFSSYVNILLVFVPVGIAVNFTSAGPSIVFAMNAIAIIPLAGLLAYATEVVALSLGDTLGALLNVSFGNAVELIIFIIALVKNEINIVQASLLGSILANLLLILGMCFLFGGLRFQEQLYNSTVTQMSACLLSLSVTSLLLPTAFHASFADTALADGAVLKLSRGTSVILLLIYILYLLFQLKSHAYMYESTPQHIIDEESHPGVLADLLNTSSSSSSDDSSTDSDSSSSSDESHHTTKVIKRAFKGRRRRKSNSSNAGTASVLSKISRSPSTLTNGAERPVLRPMKHSSGSGSGSSSNNNAVASGDEADTDGEHENTRKARSPELGTVQHRDFGDDSALASPNANPLAGNASMTITFEGDEPKPKHKRSKKEKKALKKASKDSPSKDLEELDPSQGIELGTVEEIKPAPLQSRSMVRHQSHPGESTQHQVSFAEASDPARSASTGAARRPLVALPNLPLHRPQMQKMLSQTVFSREYNAQALTRPAPTAVPRAPYGLRRTSSMPEHMSRVNSTPGSKAPAMTTNPAAGVNSTAVAETQANEKTDLKHTMSRTGAVILLAVSTALVAVCAEFLVGSIHGLVEDSSVTEAFIGLIILPIVGNAAEHVTAVTVAAKNKMDLAIGVAVGSSIQIAIFVTPVVVLLGWIMEREMTLYFTLFETVSLFASAFIVNFLVLDGRSNYLEGALLMAAYIIIAIGAFFYPNCDASSGAICTSGEMGGMGG